jgi:hypothetical protein
MTSNPKINPILTESIMPPHSSPKSITVTIDGTSITPSSKSVATGGDVTLKSTTGSNVLVDTRVNGSSKSVFTDGAPPYSATTGGGKKYTLDPSITGDVSFNVSDPTPNLGGNGTINVGG